MSIKRKRLTNDEINKLDILRRKVRKYSIKKLWKLWNKYDIKISDDSKQRVVIYELNKRFEALKKIKVWY